MVFGCRECIFISVVKQFLETMNTVSNSFETMNKVIRRT
uniref:Uncharacterized protein n=1 Tax=Arundo donax TaxID=35708 RepID=A0A0A9FXB7_ARUDO